MPLQVVFRPQAEAEVSEACQWYETLRAGLGREFVRAVDSLVRRIATNPATFPWCTMKPGEPCYPAFPTLSISESRKMPSRYWPFTAANIPLIGNAARNCMGFTVFCGTRDLGLVAIEAGQ
jgi:hypothetical protein